MQVEEQFTTEERDGLNSLHSLHIWTDEFLAKRFGNKQKPITALLLRVWQFDEPITLPQDDAYWGCFSWGMPQPQELYCKTFYIEPELISVQCLT
jgi:hypothetical protein